MSKLTARMRAVPSHTVLVVGADPAQLDALAEALDAAGFVTVTGTEPRDAVARLRALGRPAVIIADLPRFAVALAAEPSIASIPLLSIAAPVPQLVAAAGLMCGRH